MSWNNKAVQSAKAALESGSLFGNLEELQARKLSDLQMGTTYKLLRFEVIFTTQKFKQPFVTLELNDGTLYSGYATALANQLKGMTVAAAEDPANGAFVSDRKAWTEIPTEIPVKFVKRQSPAGEYIAMEFAE